jgi:hypothetical protein
MQLGCMPHKLKCPARGGARPNSGRPKLHRRSVSARVNPEIYVALRRHAKARKVKLGRLIEEILGRNLEQGNGGRLYDLHDGAL